MSLRISVFISALCLLLPLGVERANAEGFGTPTVDGALDGVYGTAEASDPAGDAQAGPPMDMLELYVVNDNTFWYFYFTVNTDFSANNWGKYLLYIDTTGDGNGAPTDAWGRSVTVLDPHKPEFSINTWVDNIPYGPEDTQFWAWDGLAWNEIGDAAGAAMQTGAVSAIEYKVAKADLGNPSTIWCEVWSTGGGTTDPAQDTSNDPADDWNAIDWVTPAVLFNSTRVDEATGGDTVPPTVVSAKALGQEPITQIEVVFSEPVDQTTAENVGGYTVSDGIAVIDANLEADQVTVILDVAPALDYGICYQVTVTGVEDLAGNPIVNNGETNVDCFKLFDLYWRAHMNIRLQEVTYFPEPDTFAIEGGIAPLTWNPTCDHLLSDADNDSIYTGRWQFCLSCNCDTDSVDARAALEYKFTHQCTDWETIDNHYYGFDDSVPSDTLDIWWNDEAPQDFTTLAIDVILRLNTTQMENPPTPGDTVGVAGSEPPLTWDVPSINELHDDGVAPDDTPDDGIYSGRFTFPANSLKTVEYKFTVNRIFECEGEGNRSLFLDDTIYSETNPLRPPVQYWDVCIPPAAIDDLIERPSIQMSLRPNPTSLGTVVSFAVPEAARGRIGVYDAGGRLVRRLADRIFDAGHQSVVFDGKSGAGHTLPQGIYYIRLQLGDAEAIRPMTLIR
jgi:hypothetical protein